MAEGGDVDLTQIREKMGRKAKLSFIFLAIFMVSGSDRHLNFLSSDAFCFSALVITFVFISLLYFKYIKSKLLPMFDRKKSDSSSPPANKASLDLEEQDTQKFVDDGGDICEDNRSQRDEIQKEISSLEDEDYLETQTIKEALLNNNIEKANNLLEEKKEERTRINGIKNEINTLKDEEDMINTSKIESALQYGDIKKAEKSLEELKEKYDEYKETLEELKTLDRDLSNLSKKLARSEIDTETFKDAKEGIEQEKYDLENKLEELRDEVIHEDYEKPF